MEDELKSIGVGVASSAAAVAAYEAWRRSTEREIIMGRPARLTKVDPSRVAFDADTFQFKSGGDERGVTDRLRGVKSWDPVAAGKAVVFERANGELVVADGHQRTGLAKRLISEGQKGIRLDAYVLRERDGWSARDVRVYAAIKNMKELSGQSLDMAKVMRERPDLVNDSLPMSDGKIREAKALANLSEPAFRQVAAGVVKPEVAAAIGEQVKDTSRHADLLDEMANAKVASGQHARVYVGQAMAAPSIAETTSSLFGDETQVRSLVKERAQVLDKALTTLKQDKRLFALLEREAGTIESAGNKLARDTNTLRAAESGQTAALVERLSTTRGPLSSMLDRAAEAVAKGEKPQKAARMFTGEVSKMLKSGGIRALMGDAVPQTAGGMQFMVDKPGAERTLAVIGRPSGYRVVDVDTGEILKGGFRTKGNATSFAKDQPGAKLATAAQSKAALNRDISQTSFLPEATTKEKIAAEMKKAGKPSVAQQDVGGLFGDGMKQIDLVDEARKAKPTALDKIDDALNNTALGKRLQDPLGIGEMLPDPPESLVKPIEKVGSFLDDTWIGRRLQDPLGIGALLSGSDERPGWSDAAREASAEARAASPMTDAEIVAKGKSMPPASDQRMDQLNRRVDAMNKAEISRALKGDEAGYEQAKRLYAKAQDQQLTAVASRASANTKDAAPKFKTERSLKAKGMEILAKTKAEGKYGISQTTMQFVASAAGIDPHDARGRIQSIQISPDEWAIVDSNPSGPKRGGEYRLPMLYAERAARGEFTPVSASVRISSFDEATPGIRDKDGNLWRKVAGSDAWEVDRVEKAERMARHIDRLERLGYQPFRDAAKALKVDATGGDSEIRARLERLAATGRSVQLEQIANEFEAKHRAAAEAELKSLIAKTGAPPDVQAKAVAAGMAESDRIGRELMKGRPGWSDAAREASAEARDATQEPIMGKAKPRTPSLPPAHELNKFAFNRNWDDFDSRMSRKTPEQLDAMAAEARKRAEKGRQQQARGEEDMARGRGKGFSASIRQKNGYALEFTYEETAKRLERISGQKKAEAKLKAESGLRGTQNAANLEAIVENRQAAAAPPPETRKISATRQALIEQFRELHGRDPRKSVSLKELRRDIEGQRLMNQRTDAKFGRTSEVAPVAPPKPAKASKRPRSNPDLVKQLAERFNRVMETPIATLPDPKKPETMKPLQDKMAALAQIEAEIKAAKLSKADAKAIAKAVGNDWIAPSASGKTALDSVTHRLLMMRDHLAKTLSNAGRTAASVAGPLAIVGAAAVAYDATRNSARAAGDTDLTASMKAAAAGAVAGGTIAAVGWGLAKGVQVAAKVAPTVGRVALRALPVAAVALASYEIGKGAYEGAKTGGFTGALKGAGTGALDFATAGAYSHFTAKDTPTPRLTADQAAKYREAEATHKTMKAASTAVVSDGIVEAYSRLDPRTGHMVYVPERKM